MDRDFTVADVKEAVVNAEIEIVEQKELPGREPRLKEIPSGLHNRIRAYLEEIYPEGLYSHQSEGIEAVLNGENVGLSTATASGKSLVYMAAATDLVLRKKQAKILALYPARALIQDQMEKWAAFQRFGLSIGYIHGGVNTNQREAILKRHDVVLMTPDVAHAWLLRKVGSPAITTFLDALQLLILDEAHTYDGAFGTNMSYFLRRLDALSRSRFKIVVSTATLGNPQEFLRKLTGYPFCCFTETDDGSKLTSKKLLLASEGDLTETAKLLSNLASFNGPPFLAFVDSRKQVEKLVAISMRQKKGEQAKEESQKAGDEVLASDILPYRAGYESSDRTKIQKALQKGKLSGVVSTSALELGLDIGDINLVLVLTTPPSVKSFRQRIGRGGRSKEGIYVLVDTKGIITAQGLDRYLDRPNEPNHLYLDNRYIQYANVLSAGQELEQRGGKPLKKGVFNTLPQRFKNLLENELDPVEPVPEDLFPLKQRGEAEPQLEFPLRSAIEKQFQVKGARPPGENNLGTLGFSQVLREAYPGGIYYYLARPYRVREFRYRQGNIIVKNERYWTTKPMSQDIVFPNLQEGVLQSFTTPDNKGFVIESHIQVSERVIGFKEKRGSADWEKHEYGPGSSYYQRPLNNFFETTGVSLHFGDEPQVDQVTAFFLKTIFCREFGILERDIGSGYFTAKDPMNHQDRITGICIYDTTSGSLRLTKMLAENFRRITKTALETVSSIKNLPENEEVFDVNVQKIEKLDAIASNLIRQETYEFHGQVAAASSQDEEGEEDTVKVIAPGEKATSILDSCEVVIKDFRYTPKGIMYDIEHPDQPDLDRLALPGDKIRPIYGESRMMIVNLITGEEEDCGTFHELPS